MKAKHEGAILRHLRDAETHAFSISTAYGRKWKAAYEKARRTHTISKSIEIADIETKGNRP